MKAQVWIDRKGKGVPRYYYTLTESAMRNLVGNAADVLRSWKQHRAIIEFYRNTGETGSEQANN